MKMRKIIAWVLAAAMLCSFGLTAGFTTRPDQARRDTDGQRFIVPAEGGFAGGSGTEDDPYQISSAEELALLGQIYEIFAQTHDLGDERVAPYLQAHYVLTEDIVLNERAEGEDWSAGPPAYTWLPIGFHRMFDGVFDGAGHKVSGLYIDAEVTDEDGSCFGLFGENGGTIKNVVLEDVYIRVSGRTADVGGIAGRSGLADYMVENCTVSGDICCYEAECGGVVGVNKGTVQDCAFSGTVTCLQEDALTSDVGGIVGYNDGMIQHCANSGAVTSAAEDGRVGGIAGSHNGGVIDGCENTGAVTGGQSAGGIAGSCFLSSIGGKFMSVQADITDCVNSGPVSAAGEYAGGIAGECTNSHSDYVCAVSGCGNTGTVTSAQYVGGVVGYVTLWGGVTVSGCTNAVDLEGSIAGGVIGSAMDLYGALTVTGCSNSGAVTGTMYAGGIAGENNIGSWDDEPLSVVIADCANSGTITTADGGGIAGVLISIVSADKGELVTVTLENDENTGDIVCTEVNAYVGGIAGNVGVAGGTVTVKDCRASGAITFLDEQIDPETAKITADELRLELSRIAGGIAGMVKGGLHLSTTNDGVTGANVNAKDAKIVFTGCHSDMTFDVPAEDEYVYEDDGTPIVLDRCGGVIGFCTDAEGFGFRVEECTFTNADRGLGVKDLPDVGTKK